MNPLKTLWLVECEQGNISYTLRVNSTNLPKTDWKFAKWVVGPPSEWRGYWTFANVQRAVDQALASFASGARNSATVKLDLYVKEYPSVVRIL